MTEREVHDSVAANVAKWTKQNAAYTDGRAQAAWQRDDLTWGVFGVPEGAVAVVGDVRGLDVVELGCGTAYLSAWLAKRGARPGGVDSTPAPLATARRIMGITGGPLTPVDAPAERVALA